MGDKPDVWQGTLALMVLRTLETMGPQHGLARRIEQISARIPRTVVTPSVNCCVQANSSIHLSKRIPGV